MYRSVFFINKLIHSTGRRPGALLPRDKCGLCDSSGEWRIRPDFIYPGGEMPRWSGVGLRWSLGYGWGIWEVQREIYWPVRKIR